jgi:uncharacterized membrane protein HdeD (DUF308 family)
MRIVTIVAGVLCLLLGCVWILQGINILPGSFMTGQTKWAIYGALLVIVGIGLCSRPIAAALETRTAARTTYLVLPPNHNKASTINRS